MVGWECPTKPREASGLDPEAVHLLSLTLEELPVGAVYTTWAALGIVGVASIGVVVFDEPIDPAGVVGMGLVLCGVYVVNVVSDMSVH
jgi:small multidrug resistance pump